MEKISNLEDLLIHAMVGGGVAGAASAIPGGLRAYSKGEDVDRGMAGAASIAIPVGMLLGGTYGTGKILKNAITDVASQAIKKLPSVEELNVLIQGAGNRIGTSVSEVGRNINDTLRHSVDPGAKIEAISRVIKNLSEYATPVRESVVYGKDAVQDFGEGMHELLASPFVDLVRKAS